MSVQDRLRALRGPLSYRGFAARVGVNVNSVRRYELGVARVPLDYVQAVCWAFRVSADWLVFGVEANPDASSLSASSIADGPPSRVASGGNGRSGRGNGRHSKTVESRRYALIDGEKVRIVCVPVLTHVPAGPALEMVDATPVGFGLEGEVWVPDPGDGNVYGLTARGDSMEPLIYHGETIIVSPRRRFDFRSGIAVVRIPGDEVCVKYVRCCAHSVELLSANPRYPRMAFDAGEAEVLGAVVQVVRSEAKGN